MPRIQKLEYVMALEEKYARLKLAGTFTSEQYEEKLERLYKKIGIKDKASFFKVANLYREKMEKEDPTWDLPWVTDAKEILEEYADSLKKSKEKKLKTKEKIEINENQFKKLEKKAEKARKARTKNESKKNIRSSRKDSKKV